MNHSQVDGLSAEQITVVLKRWNQGDDNALNELIELVYPRLHQIAERLFWRERPGHTLQPTAVVHEAYEHLMNAERIPWQNRSHFFAVAAKAMRRVLVDHARGANAWKRGGGVVHLSLEEGTTRALDGLDLHTLLVVDEALTRLAAEDSRAAKVVEMRFFAGCDNRDIAAALEVSSNTVIRDWDFAKAWLEDEMTRNQVG